jgi:prepilin-type N-terminal cleavage/methylation domain-containing protein
VRLIGCLQLAWIRKSLKSDQGYTLLEVICALAITGLVAIAVLSVVHQSISLWQKSIFWGEEERNIRVLSRSIQHFSSRVYSGELPQGEKEGFQGKPNEVQGLLETEDGLIKAGLSWDLYSKEILYWEECRGNRTQKNLGINPEKLELSYYDQERQSWVDAWNEQFPLPTMIRLVWSWDKKAMPPIITPLFSGRTIQSP